MSQVTSNASGLPPAVLQVLVAIWVQGVGQQPKTGYKYSEINLLVARIFKLGDIHAFVANIDATMNMLEQAKVAIPMSGEHVFDRTILRRLIEHPDVRNDCLQEIAASARDAGQLTDQFNQPNNW